MLKDPLGKHLTILRLKDSGTKNGGTEPYKAVLGVRFPLHKPYYIQLT